MLFGSEPFSSSLRMSNIKNYKYDWIWKKTKGSGHLNSKKRPLRHYETISVFGNKTPVYYPQGLIECVVNNGRPSHTKNPTIYSKQIKPKTSKFKNYPKDVVCFSKPHKPIHPTQKPVALIEYLIKTYTNELETVLDFTMGSGTTGVACCNTNRDFIGIELDKEYFNIAKKRIEEHRKQLRLF